MSPPIAKPVPRRNPDRGLKVEPAAQGRIYSCHILAIQRAYVAVERRPPETEQTISLNVGWELKSAGRTRRDSDSKPD